MPADGGEFVKLLAEKLQELHEYLASQHGRAVWSLECRLAELEGHPTPPRPVVPTVPDVSPVVFFSPSGDEDVEQADRLKAQLDVVHAENSRLRKELSESSKISMKASSSTVFQSFGAPIAPGLRLSSVTEGSEEWAQNYTKPVDVGALPTSCAKCGNVFMADSAFCRKCGAQRWHVEEERETAVHFDFDGGAEERRGSDLDLSEADSEIEDIRLSGRMSDKRCPQREERVSVDSASSEGDSPRGQEGASPACPLRPNLPGENGCLQLRRHKSDLVDGGTPPVLFRTCLSSGSLASGSAKKSPGPRAFLHRQSSMRQSVMMQQPSRDLNEEEVHRPGSRRTSVIAKVLPSGLANMAAFQAALTKKLGEDKSQSNGTATKISLRQDTKPLFGGAADASNGVKAAAPTFQLLDVWEQQNKEAKKNNRMLARSSQEEETSMTGDLEMEEVMIDGETSCQTRLMASPGSQRHLCWELFGIFLIAYDCVALPLETFEPPKTTFTEFFSWIVRIFWTANIAASCFTGYIDKKGEVVMRPRDVQRHYARTWLIFDILVVGFDWAEVVMDAGSRSAVSGLSAMRAVRMVRLARLFRLVKARQLSDFIIRNVRNEFLVLVAPILKGMIFLLGITHFIACIWYAVGRHSENQKTWLRIHELDEAPLAERYVWSFHVALALFTGEHVVSPQNNLERTVMVLVLMLTFIISAYFVSSITTAMTRLLIVAGQRSAQFTMLRRYLLENKISHQLAAKVQRSAKHALLQRKHHVAEGTVELLGLISEPLLWELHYEVRFPVLRVHPFIYHYSKTYRSSIRKLCHNAISVLAFSSSDVVFNEGEAPAVAKVLFVIDGKLQYFQKQVSRFQNVRQRVTFGNWVTEAVLWTAWIHRGTLCSVEEVQLMSLDANEFQKIVSKYPSIHVNNYAIAYIRYLVSAQAEELTDIGARDSQLESLAAAAFEAGSTNGIRSSRTRNLDGEESFRKKNSQDSQASQNSNSKGPTNSFSVVSTFSDKVRRMSTLAKPFSENKSIHRTRDSVRRKPRDSLNVNGIVTSDPNAWGLAASIKGLAGRMTNRAS